MAGLTRQHPPRRHMESHAQATLSPPHIRTPKHARPADLERPMSMHTHMCVHPADIWSSKRLRAAMHYMRANAPLAELHLSSAALSTSCMPHTASIRLQTTGTSWLSAAHISAAHATCNRALQKHASHSNKQGNAPLTCKHGVSDMHRASASHMHHESSPTSDDRPKPYHSQSATAPTHSMSPCGRFG